ncbi:hypothetical protein Cgig2_014888 [Carnegiea gigantea]|uniref:Uncharacterized protein n=1 Tax=Carnegiea gigantea TaxID=171969 RepID=A0A9Q1GUH5_9CARY|nr:hypothetical protein Cgig2_014888 [Carnegiea gigantea]
MVFPSVSLLKYARSIYTIEVYRLFQKEFVKGALYEQGELHSDTSDRVFRVSGVSCLEESWDRYILKRWSKDAKDSQSNELTVEDSMKDTAVCSSVWRMQMGRKLNALVTASQMNREARILCEDYFSRLKELIEVEVGRLIWKFTDPQRLKNANVDFIQNGAPLCMNICYGGSSSPGNVAPTLNLLANSNRNDQSLS